MNVIILTTMLLGQLVPPVPVPEPDPIPNAENLPPVAIEIREIEVDLLETNTVRQDDGSVRFIQIIAWDEGRDEENRPVAIDRGYKVVKDGYPCVHPYGENFRVVWWCGPDKVYVLSTKSHLVTETNYDREAKFREYGGWFRPCW